MPWPEQHPAAFIAIVTITLSAFGWFLIWAHRTKLHKRIPWPFIAPLLAVKWFFILAGGVLLVALFVTKYGWYGAVAFLVLPLLYGMNKGLNGHPKD